MGDPISWAGFVAWLSSNWIVVAAFVASTVYSYTASRQDRPASQMNREYGVKLNTRSTQEMIKVVYGQVKVGGNEVFIGTTGTDDTTLWMALTFGEGECQGIAQVNGVDQVWIDEAPYPDYGPYLAYWFHSGTGIQVVDANMQAAIPTWTDPMRYTCYGIFKLQFNADLFRSLPTVTILLQGKKLYDFRDGTTKYSNNIVLVMYDYMTNGRYGRGKSPNTIDISSWTSAANYIDIKGWGYNRALYENNNSEDILRDMEAHGRLTRVWWKGQWFLRYADLNYESPVMTISDEHIIQNEDGKAAITITEPSKYSMLDAVRVNFIDPDKNHVVDFVTIGDDLGVVKDVELYGAVSRDHASQIGLYTLERAKLPRLIRGEFRDDCARLDPHDPIYFNSSSLFISGQFMRVQETNLLPGGHVELVLGYDDITLYDDAYNVKAENVYTCTLPDPKVDPPGVINARVVEEHYNYRLRSMTKLLVSFDKPDNYPWFDHAEVWQSVGELVDDLAGWTEVDAPGRLSPFQSSLSMANLDMDENVYLNKDGTFDGNFEMECKLSVSSSTTWSHSTWAERNDARSAIFMVAEDKLGDIQWMLGYSKKFLAAYIQSYGTSFFTLWLSDGTSPEFGDITSSSLKKYTEVDVAANRLMYIKDGSFYVSNLDYDEDVMLYFDFGAGYFKTDFEHIFNAVQDGSAASNGIPCGYPWVLANTIGSITDIDTASESFVSIKMSTNYINITECNAGTLRASSNITISKNVRYYFKVKYVSSDGAYGTLYLYAYSDADMTTQIAGSPVSLALTMPMSFRYHYAFNGAGAALGSVWWSAMISNTLSTSNRIDSLAVDTSYLVKFSKKNLILKIEVYSGAGYINLVGSKEVTLDVDYDYTTAFLGSGWNTALPGLSLTYDMTEISVRNDYYGAWKFLYSVTSNFEIPNVEEGKQYDFKLKTVSIWGTKSSDGNDTYLSHLVIGYIDVPASLDSLKAIVNDNAINLYGSRVTDPDVELYELRLGETWGGSIFLAANRSPDWSLSGVKPGSHTFIANTLSTNGSYGDTPVTATAVIKDPPDGWTEAYSNNFDWPDGTHSNTAWELDGGNYYLKCCHSGQIVSGEYTSAIYNRGASDRYLAYVNYTKDISGVNQSWNEAMPKIGVDIEMLYKTPGNWFQINWTGHNVKSGEFVAFDSITQANWSMLNSGQYVAQNLAAGHFHINVSGAGPVGWTAYDPVTDDGKIYQSTTWDQIGIATKTWDQIFYADEGPAIEVKLLYGTASPPTSEVEHMEIFSAIVTGQYYQLKVKIKDPGLDFNARISDMVLKLCS